MTDPVLEDPRARDLLNAAPADAAQLAAAFARAARDAADVERGLAAAGADPVWQGAAALAFRRSISRLPPELGRMLDGYGAVAAALDAYAAELSELRPAFVAVSGALLETGAARPPRDALEMQARRLLDAFDVAREQCRTQIAAAQLTAPVLPAAGSGSTTPSSSRAPFSGGSPLA